MRNRPYPLYEHREFHTLWELVCRQAEELPEKTAFAWTGGNAYRASASADIVSKTYRQFREEVEALGRYLNRQGLVGDRIAIFGENRYEWVLAFMAVTSGGNVAVPIDRELPPERMAQLMAFADCRAFIYSESYRDVAQRMPEALPGISMVDFREMISDDRRPDRDGGGPLSHTQGKDAPAFPPARLDEDAPTAIFFTSGTTGDSKGVALSQRNLSFDVRSASQHVILNGPTVSVLPYHHAFGLVAGVLAVFHYGFPVFINSSLKRLLPEMKVAQPQNTFLVPLFVETFSRQIWETAKKSGRERLLRRMMKVSDILLAMGIDVRRRLFASVHQAFGGRLEVIICGGAALDERYVREFGSWGIRLLNGYGITECSPVVSVNRNRHFRDGSVGRPIPGCQVKIAEDGEILVKGENVMLGYHKNREATEEALQDGWYATGDLGYLDGDGFLFLTGRKKNLIILSNGENVSPEELEREVLRDEGVAEAVIYNAGGVITAQIYPREEYLGQQEYFERLIRNINGGQPAYRRIQRVVLRDTEFEKNSTKKILRHKVQ